MKKTILLIGCFCLLTMGIISISCSGKWNGCGCTYVYSDGSTNFERISAEEVKEEYGVKNCSALEALIPGRYIKSAKCKKY